MATLTAQILVGRSHSNHDGINPTHYLFLSENDRPAWVLVCQNVFRKERQSHSKITWIPTVENMLEDALLMIAIHICRNREVIQHAKSFNAKIQTDRIEVYADLEESQRKLLYQACRSMSDFPKIIISVFRGSTIEKQLSLFEKYRMDVEVCRVGYSRLYSPWTNDMMVEGSLD